MVEAFLAASRGGDLGALLAVLDPDVKLRPDAQAARAGGLAAAMDGAEAVADPERIAGMEMVMLD